MSIKLKLDGFDELLREIEKAGEKIEPVVKETMKESANTMQEELKTQMTHADVPKDLIKAMPEPTIENDHGLITARVGYKKGTFGAEPLSDGYKVVFLNYGTPHRKKHGKVKARGFITKAKNKANRKIKKQQQNALQDILKGLKK